MLMRNDIYKICEDNSLNTYYNVIVKNTQLMLQKTH